MFGTKIAEAHVRSPPHLNDQGVGAGLDDAARSPQPGIIGLNQERLGNLVIPRRHVNHPARIFVNGFLEQRVITG